jgi:hypothetical protein
MVMAITALMPWKAGVRAKTASALPANTYANGSSGVGATLTGNANGALAAQDGVTLAFGERLVVDHEATASHNGIYAVTQLGDASHPYILTRTTDGDTGAKLVNATVKVSEGASFADQEWQCTTNAPITMGTTALVFAVASGGAAIAIKDEGTTVTSAPTSLNFTGPGVAATVTGSDVTVNVPGAPTGSDPLVIPGSFTKWIAAKARGAAAPARFLMLGDSNIAGQGSGTGTAGAQGGFAASMASQFAAAAGFKAQSLHGDQNITLIPLAYPLYDPRVTLGAGWAPDTGVDVIIGGRFFKANAGTTGTFKLAPVGNVTKFRLWYPTAVGINTGVQVYIDGALVDTFSQDAAASLQHRDYAVASATHYIEVKAGAGGGAAFVQAIEVWDSSGAPLLLQGGYCGALVANLNDTSNPWSSRNQLASMAPDYAVIYCTINDANSGTALNTYVAALLSLIATAAATADGCLMVGFPAAINNVTNGYYDQMATLLRGIAQDYGWSYYDSRKVFGHSSTRANQLSLYYDTYHPNGAGALAVGNDLYSFLSGIGL